MKLNLKLEELLMFALSVYLFTTLDFSWWWFLVLILAPDIGMLGYLMNSKIGAVTYNLFHHKGVAILIYLLGVFFQNEFMKLIGVMVFAHASLDRVFGYGLKYFDSFKHTHLGEIGN